VILFGIRSPIVVEYEETCARLGIAVLQGVSVNGAPRLLARDVVVPIEDFRPAAGTRFLACAFTPRRRAELIRQARALGLELAPALVDPHAVVARSARIGDGTFLNAGAVIGAVTRIGEGVLVNRAASVGHHCLIGDCVSLAPGATLAGNVRVGSGSMIGVGAVVLPDIRIGEGAIVAGGSCVREHVPDGAFVAGNPARARSFDPSRSSLHVEDGE